MVKIVLITITYLFIGPSLPHLSNKIVVFEPASNILNGEEHNKKNTSTKSVPLTNIMVVRRMLRLQLKWDESN